MQGHQYTHSDVWGVDDMVGKIVCFVASSLGVLKTLIFYTHIQDDSILKYTNSECVQVYMH